MARRKAELDPLEVLESLELDDVQARIAELEELRAEQVAEIDKQIAALKIFEKALDVRANGRPKRKYARRNGAAGTNGEDAGDLEGDECPTAEPLDETYAGDRIEESLATKIQAIHDVAAQVAGEWTSADVAQRLLRLERAIALLLEAQPSLTVNAEDRKYFGQIVPF